ncbi:MAG TPA: hypothetical protein VNT30_22690 [Stellaceae bacterium]|nr:hypothetical protein [Stellaceae bacterium]
MSKYFSYIFLLLSTSISSCSSFDEMVGIPQYDPTIFETPSGGAAHISGALAFISGTRTYSGDYSDVFLVSDNEESRKVTDMQMMRDVNPHLFDFSRVTRTSVKGTFDFDNVPDGKWLLFSQVAWNDNDPETGPPGTFLHTIMVSAPVEVKNGQSVKIEVSGDTFDPQSQY